MKSGYHEHFDAMQRSGPIRADANERLRRLTKTIAPMQRAFAQLSVSMAEAARRMSASFEALRKASERR